MFGARPELSIPDRLDHGAILVADAERSRAFYVNGLGLTEVPRPANFDFPGFWVAVGDQQLHVIGEAEPGRAPWPAGRATAETGSGRPTSPIPTAT